MNIEARHRCEINTDAGSVELDYCENDFRIFFPGDVANNQAVKFLVLYDQASGITTVDERAPLDYKILAVFHEHICHGRKFEEFANVHGDASELRCSVIESYILHDSMITKRFDVAEYARSRILMFKFLIEQNLNPELNSMFKKSLSFLESHLDLF